MGRALSHLTKYLRLIPQEDSDRIDMHQEQSRTRMRYVDFIFFAQHITPCLKLSILPSNVVFQTSLQVDETYLGYKIVYI